MAVCYHNDHATQDKAWNYMKLRFKNVRFYRVDTTKAKDVRDKYADSGGKPYFKFYKRGDYLDEVAYMDWSK